MSRQQRDTARSAPDYQGYSQGPCAIQGGYQRMHLAIFRDMLSSSMLETAVQLALACLSSTFG